MLRIIETNSCLDDPAELWLVFAGLLRMSTRPMSPETKIRSITDPAKETERNPSLHFKVLHVMSVIMTKEFLLTVRLTTKPSDSAQLTRPV